MMSKRSSAESREMRKEKNAVATTQKGHIYRKILKY